MWIYLMGIALSAPNHQVLDLGFKLLQETLVANSTAPLTESLIGLELEKAFQHNLTLTLASGLKALKMKIGQTWVKLPATRRQRFQQKLAVHIQKLFSETAISLQNRLARRISMWKQFPQHIGIDELAAVFNDPLHRFESRLDDYYELEARTAPLLAQEVSFAEVV